MERATILVTGATGAQGGAVARACVAAGFPTRALVRDPASEGAKSLARIGVRLVKGDFNTAASLAAAARGADVLFSLQLYDPRDAGLEIQQANGLIAAARANGIRQFIQSSVSGVGAHARMPGWEEGRWDRHYWENKARIEDAARAAGFAHANILRPAFMMENFIPPKATWMFPELVAGLIRTAISVETKLALVAADDIGAAAVLAIQDPSRFSILELAGDVRSMNEIAEAVASAWRRPVRAETISPADAIAAGQTPLWVLTQQWINEIGYPARPEAMIDVGLAPSSLAAWVRARAA